VHHGIIRFQSGSKRERHDDHWAGAAARLRSLRFVFRRKSEVEKKAGTTSPGPAVGAQMSQSPSACLSDAIAICWRRYSQRGGGAKILGASSVDRRPGGTCTITGFGGGGWQQFLGGAGRSRPWKTPLAYGLIRLPAGLVPSWELRAGGKER
jgi:hypothetical protein